MMTTDEPNMFGQCPKITFAASKLQCLVLVICFAGYNSVEAGEYRYWTTATNRKSDVQLKLVEQTETTAKLKREDNGKVVQLRIDQLSQTDQEYLRSQRRPAVLPAELADEARNTGIPPHDNWPQIRGPKWRGVSDATGLPTEWDDSRNVRWKTEMPGPGTSSPIVWRDNIYVTCFTGYQWPADDSKKHRVGPLQRHLLCVDRTTGQVRWTKSHTSTHYDPELELANSNVRVHGFTTNTPACDEHGVYVFYGADGVLAYSHDGRELWHTSVGEQFDATGSAASLILYDGILFVSAHAESRKFIALKAKTGKTLWEKTAWHAGYATPIISFESRQPVLILSKDDLISGHDVETGEEMWKQTGETGWVHNTMLTAGDGMIFSCSTQRVIAVHADGSEILWDRRRGSTYSPILYDAGRVYWVSASVFHCWDAKRGKEIYQKRLPTTGLNYAAPIIADGKIYLVSREAGTAVIAAGPEYRLLAHNKFADSNAMFDATPAVVGDSLILRSYEFLYCIGINDE